MFDDTFRKGSGTVRDVFSFSGGFRPKASYSFVNSSPPGTPAAMAHSPQLPRKNLKRPRPVTDVDGDLGSKDGKKKRRLRLNLVTSRLSLPFSVPSTHIADRGSSKIAVWAKQKAIGRMLLRKAAILNRIRLQTIAAMEIRQKEQDAVQQSILAQKSLAAQLPRRSYIPPPPSPLGLSNYDAFDLEDGYPESDENDGGDGPPLVYSDFNVLDPTEPVVDDHDALARSPVRLSPQLQPTTCLGQSNLSREKRQRKLLAMPLVY